MINRRHFLELSAVSLAGTVAYTAWVEPHWLEIVHRKLPIERLPPHLAGVRLVQLSDLHVGLEVDDDYILETFARVRQLAAEVVVYTGDFVSLHEGSMAQLPRVYAELPRGSLATLGVLGNHDYGHGWSEPKVADAVSAALEERGLTLLRNQVYDLEGLDIVGLDDCWGTNFHPERAFAELLPGRPAVVLSHNPDTADLPIWGGYRGWILSGHTHGGQCKPPFLPPPLLPVRNRRYTAGEFELSGGRRLYINRGVGHLLKVRFNVRPEVTVFELTPHPAG